MTTQTLTRMPSTVPKHALEVREGHADAGIDVGSAVEQRRLAIQVHGQRRCQQNLPQPAATRRWQQLHVLHCRTTTTKSRAHTSAQARVPRKQTNVFLLLGPHAALQLPWHVPCSFMSNFSILEKTTTTTMNRTRATNEPAQWAVAARPTSTQLPPHVVPLQKHFVFRR